MQTHDLAANAAQSPVSTPSTKSSPTNRSASLRLWLRRAAWLVEKEVYQSADMPKPRNAVGRAKDLADAEMKNLLLADIRVREEAVRELAVRRGVVVKDYLTAANLLADRLVLGASKTAAPDPKWTPGAELNLASP